MKIKQKSKSDLPGPSIYNFDCSIRRVSSFSSSTVVQPSELPADDLPDMKVNY